MVYGAFPKLRVPVWGSHHKDSRILGSILGSPFTGLYWAHSTLGHYHVEHQDLLQFGPARTGGHTYSVKMETAIQRLPLFGFPLILIATRMYCYYY